MQYYHSPSCPSKLVDIATTQGAVRQTNTSAFTGGTMRSSTSLPTAPPDNTTTIDTAPLHTTSHPSPPPSSAPSSSSSSVGSGGGFGGRRFWHAMHDANLEEDVRVSLTDAKRELRRKGALPLQVELDLKLARFLVGLHGAHMRGEVNEMVSGLVELAGALPFSEDRLAAVVEAAQVVGAVGLARKRTLMLWQAVELSKSMERPDAATLDIAKKALEPAELDTGVCAWSCYMMMSPLSTHTPILLSRCPLFLLLCDCQAPGHCASSSPPALGRCTHGMHRGRAGTGHTCTPACRGVGLCVYAAAGAIWTAVPWAADESVGDTVCSSHTNGGV